LCQKQKFEKDKDSKSEILEIKIEDEKIILLKPQTFMNESGQSARKILAKKKIKTNDVLVIYDDLDLIAGTMRLKEKGRSGGHKGMESIIQSLKTDQISRLKIGIAEDKAGKQKEPAEKFVLKKPTKKAEDKIKKSLDLIPKIVCLWIKGEIKTKNFV